MIYESLGVVAKVKANRKNGESVVGRDVSGSSTTVFCMEVSTWVVSSAEGRQQGPRTSQLPTQSHMARTMQCGTELQYLAKVHCVAFLHYHRSQIL